MEIDKWVSGFKVRVFPWIDGKTIYINVAYYQPGQSISAPPVWEKTVYLTDDENGNYLLTFYLDSLVNYIAQMKIIKDTKVVMTA